MQQILVSRHVITKEHPVKTSQLPVWLALGAAFTLGIAWARAQALPPAEELGKALFFVL